MTENLPLVLDAMGGDFAPAEVVRGAVEYCRDDGTRSVLLVGRPDTITEVLKEAEPQIRERCEIVPASETIAFDEKIRSIRSKRDSSIRVGIRLIEQGKGAGFVSAGHTGAVMALSKVILGLIPGVDRPALPAPLPRRGSGYTILLDAGANVDCRPEHLMHFAAMGADYAAQIFGVSEPKVGVLSIGEEEGKGTEELREVAAVLAASNLNFVGNCEGNTLFTPRADVVVCDGFVGNVALKVAEGLAEAIYGMLKDEVRSGSVLNMIGALAMRPAFQSLKKKIDYAETGGVPLLGVRGVVVVGHGRSNAKAIRSALRVAAQAHATGLVELIGRQIEHVDSTRQRVG